jgi:hypothetical protein
VSGDGEHRIRCRPVPKGSRRAPAEPLSSGGHLASPGLADDPDRRVFRPGPRRQRDGAFAGTTLSTRPFGLSVTR